MSLGAMGETGIDAYSQDSFVQSQRDLCYLETSSSPYLEGKGEYSVIFKTDIGSGGVGGSSDGSTSKQGR